MHRWVTASLNRKFLVALGLGIVGASALFLIVLLGFYRAQLEQERSVASAQVNRLLQAALENAMLKRDLDGLRTIVDRLGGQEGIANVMILNPGSEVRFASNPAILNHTFDPGVATTCAGCHVDDEGMVVAQGPSTQFMMNEWGQEVLRSVNPVANREPCQQCHGPVAENPINGILFVDYDAATIRGKAWDSAVALMGAGGVVLILLSGGVWLLLGRFVLRPVGQLSGAAQALSTGDLSARVSVPGRDEFARLGGTFNRMADSLQGSLREIREREQFQQSLIDGMPDGVRVIDIDTYEIVAANQSYCRQVGQAMERVVGAKCHASSHGRDEPCPPTLIACPIAALAREVTSTKAVHRHLNAEGQEVYVEVTAAVLEVPFRGQPRRFIVEAIRDLTNEIAIGHEQKLSAVGELATNVAHEIRNPLQSVSLAIQGMLRSAERARLDQAELSDYLKLVMGEVDKCMGVTGRLLKLSRFPEEQPRPVSLTRAIRDVAALSSWEARETGIEVALDLPPEADCWVSATDADLRMVILNLVQNAFHAMPDGGHLSLKLVRREADFEVTVEDTGQGIPADVLPRVFDPFYSRRHDRSEGTGLGLTICKTIVESHGGAITAASGRRMGARFTVVWPASDASELSEVDPLTLAERRP